MGTIKSEGIESIKVNLNWINSNNKYILRDIPSVDKDDKHISWWAYEHCLKAIEKLEFDNPNYEFVQIITSPGNGPYGDFAIMKLKS
jgi:hypothetical protein